MKKIILSALTIIPMSLFANPDTSCNKQTFLVNGINAGNYQKCERALSTCQSIGDMRDLKCVKAKAKLNPSCNQLMKLANKLDTPLNGIFIKPLSPFSIIQVKYFGDGERDQYVVNTQGCLLKTKLDPRRMIADLEKQYPGDEWMLLDNGDATLRVNADDTQAVVVPILVKKSCRACDTVATFEMDVIFDMKGKYQATVMDNFNDAKKLPGIEDEKDTQPNNDTPTEHTNDNGGGE